MKTLKEYKLTHTCYRCRHSQFDGKRRRCKLHCMLLDIYCENVKAVCHHFAQENCTLNAEQIDGMPDPRIVSIQRAIYRERAEQGRL